MTAQESSARERAETRYVVLAVVAVASVLFAEIAGGWIRETVTDKPSYLDRVETCLTERDTPFGPVGGDIIALSAKRGALRTSVEGNPVTVVLGRSESDAERLYDAYASVATDDVALELRRKVVFVWGREPTASQRQFMVLCTLDAQE